VADKKKVAVACQGGGMHVAFAVGVLTEILADVKDDKFDLVGISGTSAGALCALMVGCSLAKNAETTPIAERAKAGDPSLKASPMYAPRRRLDETLAARKPVLTYKEPEPARAAE